MEGRALGLAPDEINLFAQGATGYAQDALGLPILVVELNLIGIGALSTAHYAPLRAPS